MARGAKLLSRAGGQPVAVAEMSPFALRKSPPYADDPVQ
jgi:hypothetical protein